MCGIAGLWQTDGAVDRQVLVTMADTLAHRGPDDTGYWHEGKIGFAHRRLALLDLSAAGHQPMATPDGRWQLTFNGEIFNYRELSQQHLPNVALRSTSDTEVLLHLLARYGAEAFGWLRGMYALALWDRKKGELLLARDPFGKKPLYYHATPAGLWFASEPKAILAALPEAPAISPEAATAFMSYEYVPAPATPWRGIEQVPAGSYQRWTSPAAHTAQRFWQPRFSPKSPDSEDTLKNELDRLLRQSVERRLIADVPVGLLLSGGLDSTTIGWYMRQAAPAAVHSFSVSFTERSFDEASYAELAAKHLGFEHHAMTFTVDNFHEALRELVPLIDAPLADASLLPTYAVSRLARQHVTVLLDGDGSDELFGGYGIFAAAVAAERLSWLKPLAPLLRSAATVLPTHLGDFSFDFKVKSFVRGFSLPLPQRNQTWLGSFSEEELPRLLQPAWYQPAAVREATDRWQEELAGLSVLDQVSLLTIYQYLQNDILVKLDRATMATSVEARTPFLDVDLAELALRLPENYKKDKYLLKGLMAGRIPAEIIRRRKKGFGIPLGWWLRGPLYEWGRGVLSPAVLAADGIFQPQYVDRLWREHKAGRADHRKKLWTLLSWQLWYNQWVTGRPYPSAVHTTSDTRPRSS